MDPTDQPLTGLRALLDGTESLGLLDELRSALEEHPIVNPAGPFALGLDASVLLNLGKGRTGVDVVDYLAQRHEGPIIVPSQSINEFWNNHVSSVSGIADRLRKRFDDLSSTLDELDPTFREFRRDAAELLRDFQERYGHVMEERVAGQLVTLFEALSGRVSTPQVPRSPLAAVAEQRHLAKIPPGFRDPGNGDFFVWAEFLLGLRFAMDSGQQFNRVILVIDDKKSDWSTKGTAHPGLCAEVRLWTSRAFETWSLERLHEHVRDTLATDQE